MTPTTLRIRAILDQQGHDMSELVSARAVIEQCRAALAEEMSAWDIDPPLQHVKDAHDACSAWLAGPAARLAERDELAAIEAQEPVAWVPIHPRTGPLWSMTTGRPAEERLPQHYPLKPLYTRPAPRNLAVDLLAMTAERDAALAELAQAREVLSPLADRG